MRENSTAVAATRYTTRFPRKRVVIEQAKGSRSRLVILKMHLSKLFLLALLGYDSLSCSTANIAVGEVWFPAGRRAQMGTDSLCRKQHKSTTKKPKPRSSSCLSGAVQLLLAAWVEPSLMEQRSGKRRGDKGQKWIHT